MMNFRYKFYDPVRRRNPEAKFFSQLVDFGSVGQILMKSVRVDFIRRNMDVLWVRFQQTYCIGT